MVESSLSIVRLREGRREALLRGKRVDLTPTEFRLVKFLMDNREAFTRKQIYEAVWKRAGRGANVRVVDIRVASIRKKLVPDLIETVRDYGYRIAGS